jgi:Ca2+-binding RTX toxin-like protein
MIDTGAGDDVIEGGTGVDTMTGGAGADKFEFSQTAEKIDSTFKAPDIIMDYNKAEGDTIKIGAGGITLIGNHVNAVKAVAFKAATATSDEVVAVTAVAEINAPAQGQAAFDVATHTLYVNTDATPAFEFAVVLTGITDFSQISIV